MLLWGQGKSWEAIRGALTSAVPSYDTFHQICLRNDLIKSLSQGFGWDIRMHLIGARMTLGWQVSWPVLSQQLIRNNNAERVELDGRIPKTGVKLDLYICWTFLLRDKSTKSYDQVTNYLETMIFFLKKLLWDPRKVKFRHLWLRWSWPNVLAYLNFWCTIGHPLVAKFSNMCYFHHLLRCPRKTWPKSTGLPWKI